MENEGEGGIFFCFVFLGGGFGGFFLLRLLFIILIILFVLSGLK